METWKRICPGCGNEIIYKSGSAHCVAIKRNSRCNKFCNRSHWSKGQTKETNDSIKKRSNTISKSLIGNVPWNKGKTGLQIPWNTGLKHENDNRIAQPWKGKKREKYVIDALNIGKQRWLEKNPDGIKRGILGNKRISKPQKFLYNKLKERFNNVYLDYFFRINKHKYYFIDILINNIIAIEVDGEYWHRGKEENDAYRENDIRKKYKILRYDSDYVWNNVNIIINDVVRLS